MKLLLRREQKTSLLGITTFVLSVRAEFSRDEQNNIYKYRLGPNVLYSRVEVTDRGSGVLGLVTRLAIHAVNISITVDDLVQGKRLEFKTIEEMAFVENHIKEASETLKAVIGASANFGGEDVVTLE
jgi:hypothetical protein